MKVLIACEYSGIVRDAFIKRGHDAISCDILPTESLGPHLHGDLFSFDLSVYDLIIAHPPCTYVCVSGNRTYANTEKRQHGVDFISRVWEIPVERLCIENPVGVLNTFLPHFPKPQYIQPYQFGHPEPKKTGLWKRNLPDLIPTNIVEPEYIIGKKDGKKYSRIHFMAGGLNKEYRRKLRSLTYQGIADAMAEQWGSL